MNDAELARLELELFVHPPSAAEAAESAARLSSDPGALADRLRLYVSLIDPTIESAPQWATVGAHLVVLIQEAPYLRSVMGTGIVACDTAEHRQLREAWEIALVRHGQNPDALRMAFTFYHDWDLTRAQAVIGQAREIDPDHPLNDVHFGYLHLKGADLRLVGYDYATAFDHLNRALMPGTKRHLSPGPASTAAFQAAMLDCADELAREALEVPGYGLDDQAHLGWTTLGRLALAGGDSAKARGCLAASVVQAISYGGPSLRLAVELAQVGDKESAASFIQRIAGSWKGPAHKCAEWLILLRKGDFDAISNPGR